MSATIEIVGTIGETYYTVIRTGTTAWDGDSFETESEGDRDDFDLPLTETPADSGRFVVTFPAAISAGEYSVIVYRQIGASPATSDTAVGGETVYWDATNLMSAGQGTLANKPRMSTSASCGWTDVAHGQTVYLPLATHNPLTGALQDADSTPSWKVWGQTGDTPCLYGDFTKRTGWTGTYKASFTLATIDGFNVGEFYQIFADYTVGSVARRTPIMVFRVLAAESDTGAAVVTVSSNGQAAIVETIWTNAERTLTSSASSTAPSAGTTLSDINVQVFDSQTTRLDARVRKWTGADITQADISSITYTIYLLDASNPDTRTAITGHTAVELDKTEVIYDTLQTDDWSSDYNFSFIPDITENAAFPTGGRQYEVDVTITPTSGQRIPGPRFKVMVI